MTLTERVATARAQPDLAAGTLTVAGAGIVTVSGDATWKGYLSADKTVLIATKTRDIAAHAYAVVVLTRLGQSFVQADLAGGYGFCRLVASAAGGGWASGRMTFDASGTGTVTSFITNTGPQPLPGAQFVTLQPDGVMHNPASPTYHGRHELQQGRDRSQRDEHQSGGVLCDALGRGEAGRSVIPPPSPRGRAAGR